jgi:hypothetical protein
VNAPRKGISHLELDAVEIPAKEELQLRVPGGGVRGKVIDADGALVRAAVVVEKDGRIAASRIAEEGTFELRGLKEGTYSIWADDEERLANPTAIDIREDSLTEVALRLEPYAKIRAAIVSADGLPVSGAMVRALDVQTGAYEELIADARGLVECKIRPGSDSVAVTIVAPPHPVTLRRLTRPRDKAGIVTMTLAPQPAKLRVLVLSAPPWPTIATGDGIVQPLLLLATPRFGRENPNLVDGLFELMIEPGAYTLCSPAGKCNSVSLVAGATTVVDFGFGKEAAR